MPARSRDELLAAAAQARAEAKSLRLQAQALDTTADLLDEAARALRIDSNHGTVGSNMQAAATAPLGVRIAAARTRHRGAAKKALVASGRTEAEAARACKVGRSTVNAWMRGQNPIPPEAVKVLAAPPFGIPATAWKRTS